MPDWIDDDIRRFEEAQEARRKTEEAKRKQQEAEAAASAAVYAQLPAVLERLIQALESDLKRFNAKFANQVQKCLGWQKIGSSGFRVTRNYDPIFSLELTLNTGAASIGFLTMSATEKPNVVNKDNDYFFVSDIDSFQLMYKGKKITYEEASRELLRPALASLYAL